MLLKYAADLTQVGHWSCLSKVKPIIISLFETYDNDYFLPVWILVRSAHFTDLNYADDTVLFTDDHD